jgi:hypothetical protein
LSFRRLLLLLLFLSLRAYADVDSIAERIRKVEEQRGEYPKSQKACHGIFGAELLYWRGSVDGVAYATISKPVKGKSTNIRTLSPHFDYDPGFRLFAGIQSPFDLFDLVFVWTRFTTQGHDSTHGKVILDDIGLIKELDTTPTRAKVKCRLNGNLLDMQLGRGIALSKYFFFRPYFGLRGVWIGADWRISAARPLFPQAFAQDSTQLKVDNDFDGIGGNFGIVADWKMPMGFGIMARGAGALVYGLTEESTRQEYFFLPASSSIPEKADYKAWNSSHAVKALWELFAGIYWETRIHKPKKYHSKVKHFHVRLFAGYELQQWPYIAQKTNIQPSRERERYSLGFEGFTGGVRIIY